MGETSGPVEVCVNKRWATLCYDGWSDVDATVACRQLGYTSGEGHRIHYMCSELQHKLHTMTSYTHEQAGAKSVTK